MLSTAITTCRHPEEEGYSCATPLALEFDIGPESLLDEPIIFAEEGCRIHGCDSATSSLERLSRRKESSLDVLDEQLGTCDIRFTFKDHSYLVEDKSTKFNPEKALALVLQDKSMRETIQLKEGMIFCIGNKLIVKVNKLSLQCTRAIWDSRLDEVTKSSVSALSSCRTPDTKHGKTERKTNSLRFAAPVVIPPAPEARQIRMQALVVTPPSEDSNASSTAASPLTHSRSPSSILKRSHLSAGKQTQAASRSTSSAIKKGVQFHIEREVDLANVDTIEQNRKSVGFRVPENSPMQEGKEHKQVVDEILEASNIEVTILSVLGDDSSPLVGQQFAMTGDNVLSFGSSSSSTVALPATDYKASEAKIRMWGSQYYLFTGRFTIHFCTSDRRNNLLSCDLRTCISMVYKVTATRVAAQAVAAAQMATAAQAAAAEPTEAAAQTTARTTWNRWCSE